MIFMFLVKNVMLVLVSVANQMQHKLLLVLLLLLVLRLIVDMVYCEDVMGDNSIGFCVR